MWSKKNFSFYDHIYLSLYVSDWMIWWLLHARKENFFILEIMLVHENCEREIFSFACAYDVGWLYHISYILFHKSVIVNKFITIFK